MKIEQNSLLEYLDYMANKDIMMHAKISLSAFKEIGNLNCSNFILALVIQEYFSGISMVSILNKQIEKTNIVRLMKLMQ